MRASALLLVLLASCGTYSPLDSHYNRGVEFYDDGKLPDAIREYRLALEDDPANVRAHYNLAVCFHDLGKRDEAAAEYQGVLRLDADNARALVSLASLKADEKNETEALELLNKAASADPHSAFPKTSLGAWYERKGDLDKAMEAYRAAVVIESGSAAGHAGIARILTKRGGDQDAAAEYGKALEADGDDVATLIGASEAREKIGEIKAAMLLLERALVNVSDRPDLWIRLAGHYEVQDRLEDAVAALWEARGLDPKNSVVGVRLKALYTKLAARERG